VREQLHAAKYFCYTGVSISLNTNPMTITVHLPPATVEELKARAAATGKDLPTLVAEAVEKDVALGKVSLRDVLGPLRHAVAASGMSATEAEEFFARQLKDVRAERAASHRKP